MKSLMMFLAVIASVGLALNQAGAAEKEDRLAGREKNVKRAHVFVEPIVSTEATQPSESQNLEDILEATRAKLSQAPAGSKADSAVRARQEEIAAFEEFVSANPVSPWTPSLQANLGRHYRLKGRQTLALQHWETAWQATRHYRDGSGKQVADYVLAHWTRLLASLGRTETLAAIFQENGNRILDQGPLSQMWARTREAFRQMQRYPGLSYQCGTYALDAVARQNLSTHNPVALLEVPSPASGFTMKQLDILSERFKLGLVPAKRERGEELIVPSVVHWRQNHYGAIIRQHEGLYEVADPTFEDPQFMSAEVINAEASGNFFIARSQVKSGWKELTPAEAEQVYGRGNPNFMADTNDQVCRTGCPPGCAPGASAAISYGETPCDGCGAGIEPGMPGWSVSEPYVNLWLRDQPLGYQPALGRPIALELSYKQRDEFATPGGLFNFGKSWQCSWLSYVEIIGDTPATSAVYVHLPGGGRSRFNFSNGEAKNYFNNLRLRVLTNGGTVTGYELLFPDGSKTVYDFFRTNPVGLWSQVFMSRQIDPQGRQTLFRYPNYNPQSEVVRLEEVIDPDQKITRVYYETDFLYWHDMVTRVVDPHGRTARFTYLTGGELSEIEDVAGLRSRLTYGTYGWPSTLTTPYGVTAFEHTGESNGEGENIDRSLIITAPGGGRHVYAYVQFCDNPDFAPYLPAAYPSAEVPQATPIGTLDNEPSRRNSFYWGPRQSSGLPASLYDFTDAHYRKARMRHWLIGTDALEQRKAVDTLSIQREPSPDAGGSVEGQKIWYDYAGKLNGQPSLTGPQILPSVIARRLPDGSTWYEYYQRDSWGRPTSTTSTYGNGSTTRTYNFTYDANGNLTQESGPSGLIATYEYDNPYRQVSRISRYVNAAVYESTSFSYAPTTRLLQSISQPNATVTELTYNTDNRLSLRRDRTATWNIEIRRESFTYHPNGLVSTHTDELGLVRTFTWDALQRVTRIDYSTGGFESFSYTLDNAIPGGTGPNILDLVRFTDRLGNPTTLGYNGLSQRTSIKNPRNLTTKFGYCPCGALETITNALPQVTTFQYDNAGRPTTVIYPGGTTRTTRYNLLGQATDVLDHSGNIVSSFTYNNQGLVTAVSSPSGQVASVAYDAEDRPTTITSAGGPTVTLTYDRLGRVLSRSESGAGTENFEYSPDGLTRHTDALGRSTYYEYDWKNRKITARNAKNHSTLYYFNAAGQLNSLIDGNSQGRSWTYDAAGRVTAKNDTSGTVLTFSYDYNGRTISRWSAAKGSTSFSYDAVGNLTFVNYPTDPDVTYWYDALDRLEVMMDGTGTYSFGYTSFGAPLYESPPPNYSSISLSYDQNRRRNRLSQSKPDGSYWIQDYTYDASERLRTVSSPAGTFTYSYAGASARVSDIVLPIGGSIAQIYDGLGRLLSTTMRNSSAATLNSHGYGYDNAHRRTQHGRMSSYVNYGYDNIGQLTSAVGYENNGATQRWHESFSYNYDPAENLTLRWNDALRQDVTVGGRNQLSSASSTGTLTVAGMTGGSVSSLTVNGAGVSPYSDGTFAARGLGLVGSYTATVNGTAGNTASDSTGGNWGQTIYFGHDANGNLTSDGQRNFTYDDENRLIRVQVNGSYRVEFTYDGLGRRRVRREYDAWNNLVKFTQYLYDGLTVIQERDINNQLVATYTRGLDLSGSLEGAGGIGGLLARTAASGSSAYYHSDGNGNVTALINTSQQVVARYVYDPFGSLIGSTGPLADENTYRFSSKEYDPKAGVYYFGFRFYEPNFQRWLNQDPLGEAGGINLYQFAGNDPVNKVDPWGLYQTDFHFYAIYYLLRSKGFSTSEAHNIAYASQYVDDDPRTNPLRRGAWARFGFKRDARVLAQYHFAGSGPDKATVRDDSGARACVVAELSKWVEGQFGNAMATGRALHTYADTWSHEGFTAWYNSRINYKGSWQLSPLGFVGHVNAWEGPDEPFRDVSKAVNAATTIWGLIPNRGESRLPFRDVIADLRKQFALSGSLTKRIDGMKALIKQRFGDDVHYQP